MIGVRTRTLIAAVGLVLTAATACGDDGTVPSTSGTPGTTATPEFPPPVDPYEVKIDPADFVEGIDNPYLRFEPGTTLIYEGKSEGERERDVVTVTHQTKEILGVTCTVVRDVVTVEGEIAEKTFDWYAQDRYGNVWYFGEESAEYKNGKVVSRAGSWEAGVDGAQPGIVMLGDPQIGDRYRQEYYKGEAVDLGEVFKLDASVTVPHGSFDGVLVTKDWTPLEPKVLEQKYYAEGIGMVLERAVRGPSALFELVEVRG